MPMKREDFGSDFKWGVSTAAYQIEGAHNIDGKGKSIWDVFANTKGKIFNNHNANTSCNFYNQYARDITLMYELNIPNFRFSLSWSRIMPNGSGAINKLGVDFYKRVIDLCLELGIEPWITHDEKRVKYLKDHILQLLRAKKEGVLVNGYFTWTLMDNFEWAEGYHPRFGLVYLSFTTNKRIVKSSGCWYQQFLEGIHAMQCIKKEQTETNVL